MIYDNFRVAGAHDIVLDFADFFSITLRNDNVQEFDTRWDEILLSMTKIPSDDILESLYKLRIRESDQFTTVRNVRHGNSSDDIDAQLSLKAVLELYDMKIHQKISRQDQKLRFRNFDARNEKIETGAVVTSRRGLSGFERGKGICYQRKAK